MNTNTRKEWLNALLKIETPVLNALEAGELKAKMPLSFHRERADYAPLEAFGRSLLGLAPWLEADSAALEADERALQTLKGERKAFTFCPPFEFIKSNLTTSRHIVNLFIIQVDISFFLRYNQ